MDLLQVLQGVATGGCDTAVDYGGHVDYRLHVDTQKLGLWPGGFLTFLSTWFGVFVRRGEDGRVNGEGRVTIHDAVECDAQRRVALGREYRRSRRPSYVHPLLGRATPRPIAFPR